MYALIFGLIAVSYIKYFIKHFIAVEFIYSSVKVVLSGSPRVLAGACGAGQVGGGSRGSNKEVGESSRGSKNEVGESSKGVE